MTTPGQAARIYRELVALYPDAHCELDFESPYQLLAATILSAQCTDLRVNQVTPQLFALADNPKDMAKLTPGQIEKIIKPCGLGPAKSKAIYATSKILLEKFNGEVPADLAALETLPGVGHKTASVVMCQAFNIPAFPVDTHIHRLAYRWGLSDGSSVKRTEEDLKKLIPQSRWIKCHLQIILFGRKYCPARGHVQEKCPICSVYGLKNRM